MIVAVAIASFWTTINWSAVGSVAGAFGALFAWRAAAASERTSEDAMRALAIAIKPELEISVRTTGGDSPKLLLWVGNRSNWDASSVAAEIRLRDGRTEAGFIERLSLARSKPPGGEALRVEIGGVDWPDHSADELVDRVTVRYSDERMIARYELRQVFDSAPYGAARSAIGGPIDEQIGGPSISISRVTR